MTITWVYGKTSGIQVMAAAFPAAQNLKKLCLNTACSTRDMEAIPGYLQGACIPGLTEYLVYVFIYIRIYVYVYMYIYLSTYQPHAWHSE